MARFFKKKKNNITKLSTQKVNKQPVNDVINTKHSENVTNKDTIKVTVTEDVFLKMRYLCEVIREVEWSGILLYSVQGSIHSPGTLELITQDIIPMNKGNATYTEYNFTEKKRDNSGYEDKHIDYVMENPEAMDWKIGHIHSHNTMDVFFSGTDSTELKENSVAHDFYLSLIVNNKMEMTARVAVYSEIEQEVLTTLKATDENGNPYDRRTIKRVVKFHDYETYNCVINVDRTPVLIDPSFSKSVDSIINKSKTPVYSSNNYPSYPSYQEPFKNVPAAFQTPKKNTNDWQEDAPKASSVIPEASFLYEKGPGLVRGSSEGTRFEFENNKHMTTYFLKYIITASVKDDELDLISLHEAFDIAMSELDHYEESEHERCITISEEIVNNMISVIGIDDELIQIIGVLADLRELLIKIEAVTDMEFVSNLIKTIDYLLISNNQE